MPFAKEGDVKENITSALISDLTEYRWGEAKSAFADPLSRGENMLITERQSGVP